MARPQKEGIDYFTLDTKMDDEVKLVEAKFGISGFGVLIKLCQIIYDNSYYIKWTEREQLLYSNRINADINLVIEVVNECLKWNLFNREMYSKYEILTSRGIQKRYIEATQRRKEVCFYQEYMLLDIQEKYPEKVIVNINNIIVNINSVNTSISTQTKVNKTKVNKNNVYTNEFEKFYSEYPRPEDKNRSFTNWKTQLKNYTVEQLMTACKNYTKAKVGTEKQYLKSSANFLGKEKPFEDYINYQTTETKSKYRDMTNYKPGE